MAKLRTRIEAELGDWLKRVPAEWRDDLSPDDAPLALDFGVVDGDAELGEKERIWPQETPENLAQGAPKHAHLFKALHDLRPEDVRVVVFGNDPYTRIGQATGRSFEQGDVTDWKADVAAGSKVSPSLKSLLAAAVATSVAGAGLSLVDPRALVPAEGPPARKQPIWFAHAELERGVASGQVKLADPTALFASWANQGVLWLNRGLTYSRWDDDHRESHRRLWAPFTERMLAVLIEQARSRPLVFVLWGEPAKDLTPRLVELQTQRGVPVTHVRLAKTGHPQWPAGYFEIGNPLVQINALIDGPPIRWWG